MEIPKRSSICGTTEEATKKADHRKLAYEVADSTTEKAYKSLRRK